MILWRKYSYYIQHDKAIGKWKININLNLYQFIFNRERRLGAMINNGNAFILITD